MALGSGSLVAVNGQHGLVITNWHVVRDAGDRIEVVFPDGFRSEARLLAADRNWDLAALAIRKPNVRPIPLSAQAPWPGEPLTIAGYGTGRYRTATGRCLQYVSPGKNQPFEMVELAASAREGDSGGPILNQRGELAGVLFGATWGRTAGSHTVPVRRFLTSVSDRFDTLAAAPITAARSPQSGGSQAIRPLARSVHYPEPNPQPPVSRTDVVTAHPSSRFASDVSGPLAKLDVNGWVASPRASSLAGPDASQTLPSAQPDAAPVSNSENRGRQTRKSPSPQWLSLLGSTNGQQLKTILAAIGLLAICFHAWRTLGNS